MTPAALAAIFGAGVAAGTINTVVGAGTLVTFPVLLALGLPPIQANVSNTVGLAPGGISGTLGYRRELKGQRRRALPLAIAALAGGLAGAALLLAFPASVFKRTVPVLILAACALVLLQPLVRRFIARRKSTPTSGNGGWPMRIGAFAVAVYGGYFGAAQGVILMGLLPIAIHDNLQRLNALKNVLSTAANLAAAVVYVAATSISWPAAAAIALGSIVGGQIGARVGLRLSPGLLRVVVVAVGVAAAVRLLV